MKKLLKLNGIVVLFVLLLIVAVSTYFIPAGEYARVEVGGKTIVDGSNFTYLASNPTGFFDFFKSIPKGISEASSLIIMIFLIGGAIKVFESTNSIRAFIYYFTEKFGEDKSSYILVIISIFFAMLGAFPGMLEAVIPFTPLCISIALTLGYDLFVGISISLVPIVIGWASGVTNPWTTGIGQSLAELKLFSGIEFRFLVFIVFLIITIAHTLWYAKKIKNKNLNNLSIDYKDEKISLSPKHVLCILIFTLTIGIIVYGSLKLKWDMMDMSASYIICAILIGILFKYSPNEISSLIIEGGRDMFIAAFAIGIARGISVIMTDSMIIDSVVKSLVSILDGKSQYFSAVSMFFIQTFINFFVPSGSGQAVVTLPIVLPASDIIGLNRQIAILAFQFGDGLSNLMYPTVGALIAILSYAKISFIDWIKFIWKYLLMIYIAASILLVVSVMINFS